jgi:uncharacterized metal-binding protein YceD (DUF177 family)
MDEAWSVPRRWTELRQAGQETLAADEASRSRVARLLDLEAVDRLVATLTHEPWLDGARVHGRVEAIVTRLCGVSLEPFEERVDTPFDLHFVPNGSPNAPAAATELTIDPDADDPPEVLDGDSVDLGVYVVETLALALEPFPRKPGSIFDYVDDSAEMSPLSVLKSRGSERLD